MKPPKTIARQRRKRWVIPVSILGSIVLVAAGGLFWFFGGEAPAPVDLAATATAVSGNNASIATPDIGGTWVIDDSVGTFTFEATNTATFVGFRVDEVLNSIGSTTAVGRTPVVTGSIAIAGTTLTSAEITADLTSIVSDQTRREDNIQRALDTSANPDATFSLTEPIDLGDQAAAGEAISVTAVGDLTINGVTNEVEIGLDAQLVDGIILVTGSLPISFDDYDVTAPTSPVVLSVEDNGVVEFQLWLTR